MSLAFPRWAPPSLAAAVLVTAAAAAPPVSRPLPGVEAVGEVAVENDTLLVKGPTATLVIGAADADAYRVTAEVQPAAKAGATLVQVMPADPRDFARPAALYASLGREGTGLWLQPSTYRYDDKAKAWADNKDLTYLHYKPAPTDKAGQALVAGLNPAPQGWHGRWLQLRAEADRRRVALWWDGRLVREAERPAGARGPVAVQLQQGDRVRNVRVTPVAAESLYVPVDLASDANDRFAKPLGRERLELGGVPFEPPAGEHEHLSLRQAGWIEEKADPADYYERYDGGPPVVHDPRQPLLRVPLADYTAAHLLAVADDDPNTTQVVTLRAGRYGYSEQVVQHDFAGRVPRRGEAAGVLSADKVDTPAGPLFHVRVPMTEAFAQDLEHFLEIELTKEVRLARRQPDPCRFRLRPLGLPSGVRVAALTLERSPLQMRVGSKETGHAFVEPQQPTFQVRLQNITPAEQAYQLTLTATHLDGTQTKAEQAGRVPAGQAAEPAVTVPTRKRGYHDLRVTLLDGSGRTLLERRTSFALLPPDTRQLRASSPFGTWDFCGGHFTSGNPDETGPLYVKLGLRYGMFGYKMEQRQKYGILPGAEPKTLGPDALKAFEAALAANPDLPRVGLICHEDGVSGKHLSRVPDLFHDRPPYRLDAEEQKAAQKLYDEGAVAARAVKGKFPGTHLRLGNGALPTKEEYYRRKFPAELFDSAGNESAAFGRPPEAQPPDCVAHNAGVWMDRQLLDAYGYKDKPVTHCYELCYPCTNPGNLDERTQADYLVRHALHSLAWGMPHIKIGCLSDMGNSYYFSNWGASGFCRSRPELSVKPSFVAFATLTRVLDGAKFVRDLPLGSPTLYGLEFERPDGGRACALWTVRGRRPVRLTGDAEAWTRIDDQGSESALPAAGGAVEVTLTTTPVYLVGKGKLTAFHAGPPAYEDKPAGKSTVLSPLGSLDDWSVQEGRDVELEYYDMMCPRRKGDFAFEPAAQFEGKERVLRVTPRPIKHGKDTMPMYAVLLHKKGIPVPGEPTEIGLWVNGNSGWGRPIFELTDASGQRWISIGAQQDVPAKWVEDWVPKEVMPQFAKPGLSDWNTEDVFGQSRINFDRWRYVAFPLPGNYPGERHPWPANSQWRWDRDGVVHYPLTFRRLVVELPEKVLHVKTWAPPPRPEVYFKDLTAGQE
jgi:hypothetical protein